MSISGAALVVNLLLITSTLANTLPIESNSSLIKSDRNPRYGRVNVTGWVGRNKSKSFDVALNELNPKDSTSEEHTEKNAKYKDRGRVKFNLQSKSTTQSPLKRTVTASQEPDVIIVTPTPEVKKPAQIISSMQTYKKTKMPAVTVIKNSEPVSAKLETQSEERFNEEDEDENKESFEKYTSTKFDDSSYYTSFDDDGDDFSTKKYIKHGSNKKSNHDYNTPVFDSYFPKNVYTTNEESYKSSDSFYNFDSDLTTPKNDFFDKKHQEISSSILNNLDTIKAKSPPPNVTNVHKIVKENVGFEKLSNNTPTNKSTVFIKNTKEIRFLDNDEAGTNNKRLSDVQGTSIYYEMTVLSTETYNIKEINDDDCDGDNQTPSSTLSTPIKDELASIKAKYPEFVETSTRRSFSDSDPSAVSLSPVTMSPMPSSTYQSIFSSLGPVPVSTQNVVFSTDTSRLFSSNYNRNRNYSKRLNLSGTKDSPNSVFSTLQTEQASSNQAYKPQTRRFHYTTPKTKPIWMAPRKNVTKSNYPRLPTTIYSEHFDIKDKMSSTHKPKLSTRTILTTQSSDIDPVLQTEVSGVKKIVQTQSISDNTIPSLGKRGSTKFSSSTSTSAHETRGGINDMEIPPTLTAWALASMRSPPSLSSNVVNATGSTQKSVDENELQKVGEILGEKLKKICIFTIILNHQFIFETKQILDSLSE